VTSFRQADGNTFITQSVQVNYYGDIYGPVVSQTYLVIHPDGTLTGHGTDVCSCTVASTGASGTITVPWVVKGDVGGNVIVRIWTREGTGGLENLHVAARALRREMQ